MSQSRRSTRSRQTQDTESQSNKFSRCESSSSASKRYGTYSDEEESMEPQRKQSRLSGRGGAGSGSGGSQSGGGIDDLTQSQEWEDGDDSGLISFSQALQERWVADPLDCKIVLEEKDLKKAESITSREKEILIALMMRFLLMKGLKNEPITKDEILKQVIGKVGEGMRKRGVLKYILGMADEALRNTFGYRLKASPEGKPYTVKDTYYLMNTLENPEHSIELHNGPNRAARGLLMVILALIYCNKDRQIPEDVLFKRLNELDKRIPDHVEKKGGKTAKKAKTDAVVDGLGDVHEQIANFVKQHYLQKKTIVCPSAGEDDVNMACYTMGARAYLEVGRRQIVTMLAETLGQSVDRAALEEMSDNDEDEEERGGGQ